MVYSSLVADPLFPVPSFMAGPHVMLVEGTAMDLWMLRLRMLAEVFMLAVFLIAQTYTVQSKGISWIRSGNARK